MLNLARRVQRIPRCAIIICPFTRITPSLLPWGGRTFHSTFKAMVAQKIDGTAIAKCVYMGMG
jgi:hypothetical protein